MKTESTSKLLLALSIVYCLPALATHAAMPILTIDFDDIPGGPSDSDVGSPVAPEFLIDVEYSSLGVLFEQGFLAQAADQGVEEIAERDSTEKAPHPEPVGAFF